MASLQRSFHSVDGVLTRWSARNGVTLMRIALGIVFFWFGVLKLFPGLSPATTLAGNTISVLSFGMIPPHISVPVLAIWECAIGLGLITGKWMRVTILLLMAQMSGTLLPLVFFPEATFTRFPYAPTLEGQYIIKNLVLVTAALVLGATVRGGYMTSGPGNCE